MLIGKNFLFLFLIVYAMKKIYIDIGKKGENQSSMKSAAYIERMIVCVNIFDR